ncbi:hypothetical protein [Acetobacterium bakii]|uniref:Adhesin n=1 Tax=Acetobacterium bakii TaxID=52689 RepID=A0A0L6U4T9_9FIRM|nr:hypothetical protein [Acetobacterium bakii]KNZ43544.1 hypothetical protein AKG39_00440 [Acetobacterium bakii]
MIITDEAKVLITELLKTNGYDTLQASLQKGCCGTSLYFSFTNLKPEDKPVLINEINVLMNDEAKPKAETVTLKTNETGELVVEDSVKSGCC